MQEFTLTNGGNFMNTIKIENVKFGDEKINAVDARELHGFLGSKKKFADWIKNKLVNNPFFMEETDYVLLHQSGKQKGSGGHNRKDYVLTIDTAKKIAMSEQTDKGNAVRDYFLECEKVAKAKSALPVPESFSDALLLAAKQQKQIEEAAKEIEAAKKQIEIDAPKVKLANDLGSTKIYSHW